MLEKMERRAKALEISAVLLSRQAMVVNAGAGVVVSRTSPEEMAKEKTDALFMIADLIEADLALHAQ